MFLPTKLRVFTHRSSCFYTPKEHRSMTFCVSNQQLGDFTDSRNSSLTVLTNSRAVENHDRLRTWQHRLLGASPPPARPLRGPLGTLRVPPTRHPPGLRPRPTASPLNRPPKGAVYVPQQGGGLPPPLSGASRLPVRPPRKGLCPSPPLRGGSPPQQPAIKNENATFVPRRDCLCLRGGARLTTVPRLMETEPAATPQGQMCIECRAFD